MPCPNCGAEIIHAYCGFCGERRLSDHGNGFASLARESVESFFNVDGRAVRTFQALIRRPGTLTVAYVRGVRRVYLGPFNCFVIANIVYFIWATATGSNTLATPLAVHMSQTPYRAAASAAVAKRLAGSGESMATFERRFDARSQAEARSLVIFMIPAFAAAVGLVCVGSRRPPVQHVVFAIHSFAALLIGLVPAAYVAGAIELVSRVAGRRPLDGDTVLTAVIAAAAATYLFLAVRRAYGFSRSRAWITTLLLVGVLPVILVAYRAMLFAVTLWTTPVIR